MSSVLVIGGDKLGNITDLLQHRGFETIHHVTGRKASQNKVSIPSSTKAVLVFTDFVNHNLSRYVKNEAKSKNVPIFFCKRSYTAIEKALH